MRDIPPGETLNLQQRNLFIAIAATMAVIAYGSLYPFAFHAPTGLGPGPFLMLIEGWNKHPGRGDFVSNILLYMPLGFLGGVTAKPSSAPRRLFLVILLGAGLSLAMESLQYYDAGRDTEATDLYANIIGTMLGALLGYLFGRGISWSFLAGLPANPMPVLLLVAWAGYVLYPYVPTENIHKYWDTLKPVMLYPSATPYAVFRQTTIWLAIGLLVEGIAGPRRARLAFALFAVLIVGGSILIITVQLTVPRLAGIALGFGLWRLSPARARLPLAAILLGVYVVALRLEPFAFAAVPGNFTWIPFQSFMQGSIDLDVQSFCEKFFLYGTLVWLLVGCGLRLPLATGFVAAVLFATSLVEVYIPGRSAEITDALIALAAGFVMTIFDGAMPRPRNTLTARMSIATDLITDAAGNPMTRTRGSGRPPLP